MSGTARAPVGAVHDRDEYLTPREAAALTKLSERTLANRRSLGMSPPYTKLSRGRAGRIRYSRAALLTWLSGDDEAEVA